MIKASHSEVESFLTCGRRWYYGYVLKIQGIKSSPALAKGSIGHAALEAYYRAKMAGDTDPESAAYEAVGIEAVKHNVFNITAIELEVCQLLEDYFNMYREEEERWQILEVELDLDAEVVDGYTLPLKIDLIVRIPGHGIVAIDHKFVYDFMNERVTGVLPQLPKYMLAARQSGYEINEIWYSEIRTRVTKENTANPSLKFERSVVDVNGRRLIRTIKEQIAVAKRIGYLKEQPNVEELVWRAGNSNICKSCPFIELCSADLVEEDTAYLRETSYKIKEKRV